MPKSKIWNPGLLDRDLLELICIVCKRWGGTVELPSEGLTETSLPHFNALLEPYGVKAALPFTSTYPPPMRAVVFREAT